jgi:hypothetical protein
MRLIATGVVLKEAILHQKRNNVYAICCEASRMPAGRNHCSFLTFK